MQIGVLFTQIRFNKHLKKLVSVDVADKTSCVVVCCYVGGILGEDIAYDLVDGIIAFLTKSVINNGQIPLEFALSVLADRKSHSLFVIHFVIQINTPSDTIYTVRDRTGPQDIPMTLLLL